MSDWTVNVLRKKSRHSMTSEQTLNKARREGAPIETYTKSCGKNTLQMFEKLANDMENLKHEKISLSLAKLISQRRLAKGMTQKELATKICEKVHVINDYEAGRAIQNNIILNKIERALGTKLRGKEAGQPLNNKPNKSI